MSDKIRVADEVKKLVYTNPALEPIHILAQLTERGIKTTAATVATQRSDFLNSLNVLRELNAFAAPAPAKKVSGGKKKAPSRATRWADACARATDALGDLKGLQEEYEEWKSNLPESLASSPIGEKLEAVCEIDLDGAVEAIEEAEGADLPLGFGRD